jgi:hypothetical protein
MLKPNPLQGNLHLGISLDFADRGLSVILAQLTHSYPAYPAIRLDVLVDTSSRPPADESEQ